MQLFLAFVVALSVTAALIPLLARWAPAIGLTDRPGPRKLHSTPVPRVGGLAMAAGIAIPTVLTVSLTAPIRGTLLGMLVLLLFGVWDDRVSLGYRAKFAGQIIAVALCVAVGGVRIGSVTIAGVEILPGPVSILVTAAFLIGITNAVNLADGLDGLAGGMVLLCLCAVALFAASSGNQAVTMLCLIEAGAVLGFLRFNTHPARVFMGDSGSQVLGFSVGVLALLATQGDSSAVSAALPLLILGLPIVDTLSVMFVRIRAGRSPFRADSNHVHHKLLALGFAHREAVAIIYLMQVALVLIAYFLRFESDVEVLLAFCAFAILLLCSLHEATRLGWKIHETDGTQRVRAAVRNLIPATRLAQLTLGLMISCLLVYAATVLTESRRVGLDIGVMCLAMLIALLLLGSWKAEKPLRWFERVAAYVSVVLLVYLDQTAPHKAPALTTLSWTLIAITGVAAVVRFSLTPSRRFEVTALDVIVVFIALVLPNLPGIIELPPALPSGVAKAVILLYVVEMLLTIDLKHLMPRVFLGLTLAVIAGRALLGVAA